MEKSKVHHFENCTLFISIFHSFAAEMRKRKARRKIKIESAPFFSSLSTLVFKRPASLENWERKLYINNTLKILVGKNEERFGRKTELFSNLFLDMLERHIGAGLEVVLPHWSKTRSTPCEIRNARYAPEEGDSCDKHGLEVLPARSKMETTSTRSSKRRKEIFCAVPRSASGRAGYGRRHALPQSYITKSVELEIYLKKQRFHLDVQGRYVKDSKLCSTPRFNRPDFFGSTMAP
jgi:hypothetical protein